MMHQESAANAIGNCPEISPQAMREVLHDLRQHQIELEMQNEELRRTQAALDIEKARFFDFYDLAPVGYLTVSDKAAILQVNLTTSSLLGVPRSRLIGRALAGFIFKPDADRYYLLCREALASGSVHSAELRMRRPDGQPFWAKLQAIVATGDDGAAVLRLVLSDITERKQMEQAAKESSEQKFRLVADNTSDGIVIFGADRRIEYVSPAYVKQLGYGEDKELGRSPDAIYALIHPEDRDALFADLERAIATKASELLYAYRIRHRAGHYIWREDHARFQYDGFGNYSGACVVARDISARRQAEVDLQASEKRYRRLLAELPVGAVVHGPGSEILLGNAMALDLLGLTEEQLLGKTSFDPQWNVIHEDGTPFPGPTHPAPRAMASGQPVNGVVMGVFRPTTQSRVWLLVNAHPQLAADGSQQVVVTFSDVTERKQAQLAMLELNRHLTEARQQLRRLVALNESTLEKEKRHIAREVHDELGQVLTALRMDLSLAIIRHAGRVPDLLDSLNGMKLQVDRAILGVRNVATSLRPAALDLGLVPAIEWLCQEFTRHSGVVCELQAPDGNLALDASRAVVVFRIVQESLTNTSKYAQASQVSVSLSQQGHALRLQMRDNGIGFDLAAVAQRGSLGLLGMRERVLALGGQVEVTSTPGQGTAIAVVIPFDADAPGGPA